MKNGHLEIEGVVDLTTGTVAPDQMTLVELLKNQRQRQVWGPKQDQSLHDDRYKLYYILNKYHL